MKDDKLYVIHIAECIERIEQYTTGGRDEFFGLTLIQDGVLRNLQTLAESTQRLSDEIKSHHPETDWKSIAGFRNVLAHNYLGVDIDRVWQIVARDLPALKAAVEKMKQSLDSS